MEHLKADSCWHVSSYQANKWPHYSSAKEELSPFFSFAWHVKRQQVAFEPNGRYKCIAMPCVFFYFWSGQYTCWLRRYQQITAVNSYPKLVCVKIKEEKLSSGSSAEALTDEGIGYESITSYWKTLLTNYPITNISIPLVRRLFRNH